MSGGDPCFPKAAALGKEEEPQAICSFRGAYANRGNGMSAARFDEVRGAECSFFNAEPSEAGLR